MKTLPIVLGLLMIAASASAATTSYPITDATGTQRPIAAEQNGSNYTPHSQPEIAGAPVSVLNPMPMSPRAPNTLTMTIVNLPANTSVLLKALNPTRKSIQILNIGVGFATVMTYPAAGANTVSVGAGYPLEPAASAGHQGGSTVEYDGSAVSTDEWDGISTAGTTLLIIEGN